MTVHSPLWIAPGECRGINDCEATGGSMRLVEQHVIRQGDLRYASIDAAAFASKNLWNAANYLVRQAFIHEHNYLNYGEVFRQIRAHEAYQALPRKVSNQVLLQLHTAWQAFFAATAEYAKHPEKFGGRPKLPKYKHKTSGRNLLTYEWKAISKRALKHGMIALTNLGELVPTKVPRKALYQVRIAPRGTHYIIEVIYEHAEKSAEDSNVCSARFASLDLGVNNLAALTSNVPGFTPVLINGRPLKSINQLYNKERARMQQLLTRQSRFTCRKLDALTDKRNRRVQNYLHVASRRIIALLIENGMGLLIIGKNPLWKQEINLGKRNNQQFVQIPHARFIEMLTYKAALAGIEMRITEEAYTSKASFLDRDDVPPYDLQCADLPHFSGRRISRGLYRASGNRVLNADVNGSYNIARKVVPEAFDGPGIAAPAVEPIRLAVK
jgi:putative transposase